MPGNEVGDRVHNFFAQDNLSQGQHSSPTVDGSWPGLSNNLWPGSQRQAGALNSSSKGYSLPQSEIERGLVGNPLHGSHGLTFTQSTVRPEHAKSQAQSQQPNFNGFMYGNQFYQTRQDEGSFLAVDANSAQRNMSQRSISAYGSQQVGGAENQGRPSVRSETSASPVGFDFFGGPQQMTHQQLSMLQSMQSMQHQPSGMNDMQQLQQQVILMKMQEFQRQQQLQQMDARQQSLVNSPFAKASGSQSPAQMNGTMNSDSPGYQLPNDGGNPSWMQRNPLAVQGSSNGLVFPPNQGLPQRMVDYVPPQVEQSLYGVPVSSSRGNLSQYPHLASEKPSVQQLTNNGNFLSGNQLGTFPGQVKSQDRASIGRQRFTAEHGYGQLPGHAVNTAMDVGNVHQFNSMQRNVDIPDTRGRQEQSETLQETADTQSIQSQDNAGLDPTEERILFGSDDNIWAAFGKSPSMGGEGSSLFDSGGANGISSLQSGSWSALMQSAVAETSSGDMGVQEEWSGLNFHTSDVASGNQHPLSDNDGRKQHQLLAGENLPMTPSFGSGSVPRTSGTTVNKNYQSNLGFQQFGRKSSNESSQGFSKNHAQGLDLLSDQHGSWSNGTPGPKSVAEGSHMHVNAPHSQDGESSGPNQLYSKSNGWNVFGSATSFGDAALTNLQGSERSFQHSENTEQKRMLQRGVVDGGAFRKSNSGQDSRVELEQVKSRGNSVTRRDGFSLNNAGVQSDSSNIKAGEASGHSLLNSYQHNYWKNIDSSAQARGSEVSGGSQQDRIFSGKQECKGYELDNSDKQENSTDSYRSNSHHNSVGGHKENACSDAIDSRGPSTGKQKISNHHSRKNSSSRKFQYHPMGNLDDDGEPPQAMKQPFFSQGMSQFAQSNFLGQLPKNSFEAGKGQSPELQRSTKGFDESMSPVNFSRPIPHNSAPFNRPAEMFSPDKASQSSQNMLELLHKVDQSKEHAGMVHAFASDANAALEAPQAETSDGSGGGLQRSQSSNSQGFGLQLGPPMQRVPIGNQSLSSQSSMQMAGSFQPSHVVSEIGRKGQSQLVPSSRQPVPPSTDRSKGEGDRSGGSVPPTSNETSLHRLPGNFSTFNSGFPHLGGSLQSQEATWASGQLSRSFDKHAPMQKDEPRDKPPATESAINSVPDETGSIPFSNSVSSLAQQNSVNILPGKVVAHQISAGRAHPFSHLPSNPLIGTPSRPLPNMWSNVHAHQQSLAAEFQKVSSHNSQVNLANVASNTSASLSQADQDGRHRNFPSEFSANTPKPQSINSEEDLLIKENNCQQELLENGMKEPQGKEPVARTSSDGSPANSLSTQRDIEAFGRSLKPNNTFQQNHSLLNQMSPPESSEDDPSSRPMKRMKGPDSIIGSQNVPSTTTNTNDLNAIVGDALVPRQTIASVDSAMVPENIPEAQHGSLAAQGMYPYSQDVSHSSSMATSTKVDHLKISPQMAPSWFNQYGNFRNGQILSMYDARRGTLVKSAEQPFTYGKSPSSFHSLNSMDPPTTANVNLHQVGENGLSAIPSGSASGQQTVMLRSKKRKSCTSELEPWHKEVSQDSQSLQTISVAEVEWAKAAKRRIDKVGEDMDLLEDGSKFLKPKKRLLLSTHLMQKLLRPPSAAILSSDASSVYEDVAYSVSRLALGDACGMVSLASNKSRVLGDSTKRLLDEDRISERVDDRLLVKTIDNFMARTKTLENEFLRLEKRASVLDLIVECQDLEKFSVINRFAKFHGRGQADNTETASSSDAAANTQKSFPQRYVTALPSPRNLPTNIQCFSL